jgi:ADP-dependent NAD(P)H-hydrate dehydratase
VTTHTLFAALDETWLRNRPLPAPDSDGDKEARGKVVIVAGSREMPGAAILSAVSAMRAGAGKLVIATGSSIAAHIATAVPEARVVALDESDSGGIAETAARRIAELVSPGDGLLIGPGMQDEAVTCRLVGNLLPQVTGALAVLDAIAMNVFRAKDGAFDSMSKAPGNIILTPHAGEMAHLTGLAKSQILKDPATHAGAFARKWKGVVVLKGAVTFIASSEPAILRHHGRNAGLAVSGSGDVLAGIIVGLLARGASPNLAAAWGVAMHALAGEKLASGIGPIGFLAREIPNEIPAVMKSLNRDPE